MEPSVPLSRVLGPILRGKIDGREHTGPLCSALGRARACEVVLLDFLGVQDLSASWISAALVPLLTWAALPEHDVYPVLTNVPYDDRRWPDEFELVADKAGVVFLLRPGGGAAHRLIGTLDPPLLRTFRAVWEHGEVTGAGLKRMFPDEPILATGWSNRLKDLHTKRLLRRTARGRELLYTTVLEVDLDGTRRAGDEDREVRPAAAAGGPGLSDPHAV